MNGPPRAAAAPPVAPPSSAAPWPEAVQRVADALAAAGHPHPPVWLDVAARTSQQAADALGVAVGQIAKSVIFRRAQDDGQGDGPADGPGGPGTAVLVVTSGDRRVDEAKVAALVGPLARADAAFVRRATGFVIGGVAPVAHANPPVTLIDRELARFDRLWAAAGHPNAVFPLAPGDLQRLTGAPLADVTASSS